ncbi:MAG TPA: carotenoid biosynthesis protein [Deinococcales bacterium]|nr:carotenoid biosynthesis protein [Deinococcales bacterium]
MNTAGESARRAAWILFLALPALQLPYPFLSGRAQESFTVLIVVLAAAFSVAHLAATEGARAAAVLTALCVVICGGAEALSIATGWPFGYYNYGPLLGPPLLGVPVLVPVAWLMAAYPAYRVGQAVAPRYPVLAGALALTAWDLFLDPRMVASGAWTWDSPAFYAGIPLRNYFGWLITSLALLAAFQRLAAPARPARGSFALLPVALYAWLWLGYTFLNVAWWRDPLVAAVGGVGMGLFALPAMARAWAARRA